MLELSLGLDFAGCGIRRFSCRRFHALASETSTVHLENALAVSGSQVVVPTPPRGNARTCGTLTRTGRCRDDGVAEWCSASGARQQRDCAADGLECAYIGDDLGFYCVEATACGELTYEGRCDGNTARWCAEDGTPRERNCTEREEVCAYIDDTIGFYCTSPAPAAD